MHEVEAVETAKALSQRIARMIKAQLKKLDFELKKPEYDSTLTSELVKLANAGAKLTDQVRKLEDRENERTAALTFDEQIRLIATQFFAQLPEQHQRTMLNLLNDEIHRSSTQYMLTGEVVDAGP